MTARDSQGNALTGASPESAAYYQQALKLLLCYIGDPLAETEAAIATSPRMPMGYALKAWLHLLGTEPGGLAIARAALQSAKALPANRRETGHLRAIASLVEGGWHEAADTLEDLSIQFPRDPLALLAGHQLDFFTGDARMLRDRIARALPAWSDGMPGYHALLGMHAFGLEETGEYARAEASGRRAIELEPRDGWAQHAVVHVMEMQGRHADGIAWMRADPDAWSRDSFFAVHNWWHLALFHLDLGEPEEVLRLYDGKIDAKASTIVLEMIDASALLWRLHLRGIDVGRRWESLADRWEPIAGAANYAFNDAHAMMAFVGAHRPAAACIVLEAQLAAMDAPGDNATFTREVGYPVALALRAFGEGDYAQCVSLLRPLHPIAHRFGGSHAQRDLLDLTLIEAALRDGQHALASALIAQRAAVRPTSPFTRRLQARVAAGPESVRLERNAA
jgi:tetratricopeptide (TPR) repeat protein